MLRFILKWRIAFVLVPFFAVTSLMAYACLSDSNVVCCLIVTTLASLPHLRHPDCLDHWSILLMEDKLLSRLGLIVHTLLD